jgi:hypothetical protein
MGGALFPRRANHRDSAALKWEHCHPGDALVDDRSTYRRMGLWEAAGGLFIHHRTASETIEELRSAGFRVRSDEPRARARVQAAHP